MEILYISYESALSHFIPFNCVLDWPVNYTNIIFHMKLFKRVVLQKFFWFLRSTVLKLLLYIIQVIYATHNIIQLPSFINRFKPMFFNNFEQITLQPNH